MGIFWFILQSLVFDYLFYCCCCTSEEHFWCRKNISPLRLDPSAEIIHRGSNQIIKSYFKINSDVKKTQTQIFYPGKTNRLQNYSADLRINIFAFWPRLHVNFLWKMNRIVYKFAISFLAKREKNPPENKNDFHTDFQQKQFISPLLFENDIFPLEANRKRKVCETSYTKVEGLHQQEVLKREFLAAFRDVGPERRQRSVAASRFALFSAAFACIVPMCLISQTFSGPSAVYI